jgi:hypothetical protein
MSMPIIKVRKPTFDFSEAPVVWGPNAEAVIGFDAGSPIITLIEIFLLKVMRRVKAELDQVADAPLLRDADLFMRQEAQHYKVHAGFNKAIREWCPEVAAVEAAYDADLQRFLDTESLRWLVGYCEAFEALGGVSCINWIDGWSPELAGTFSATFVEMYRWHMAEEFEHRTVMWRVYHRLFGAPADEAHAYRLQLFEFGVGHIRDFTERCRAAMLDRYREGMSPSEVDQSQQREADVTQRLRARVQQLCEPIFSPDYNPLHNPEPLQLDSVLGQYETV